MRPTTGTGGGRAGLGAAVALTVIFCAQPGAAGPPAAWGQQTAPSSSHGASSNRASPFAEAEALLQQGRLEEAKNKIHEELLQNPSSVEGYSLLGVVCTQEKNYPEALAAFEQGLKLDPNSIGVRNDLGNLYVVQGKIDLAEKAFREVLRLDPTNHYGDYNLALVLLAKKQPAEAIAYLQRIRPPNDCLAAQPGQSVSRSRQDRTRVENRLGPFRPKSRQRAGALHAGHLAGKREARPRRTSRAGARQPARTPDL